MPDQIAARINAFYKSCIVYAINLYNKCLAKKLYNFYKKVYNRIVKILKFG